MPLFAPANLAHYTAGMHLSPGQAQVASAPPSSSRWPMHAAIGAMAGGQLADALSTRAALARGATEANPLLGRDPSLGRVLATKAATMVPLGLLLEHIYPEHHKLALISALAAGGAGAAAAIHNAGTGAR